MKSALSLRLRVAGTKTLTYGIPDQSRVLTGATCREKMIRFPRNALPVDEPVVVKHPQACLWAAGHRTYQEDAACEPSLDSPTASSSSAEQVLTQEEVDALLDMVSDGRILSKPHH